MRSLALLGLAAWLVTTCGCANYRHKPPDSLPPQPIAEISDVPFFPQESFQCGPAALAMALNWSSVQVSPLQLKPELFIEQRQGSLQLELLATSRRYNRIPITYEDKFADLWALLEQSIPVIVLQNLALSWYPKWHYAVVVGYDSQRSELLLRSGTDSLKRVPLKEFEVSWRLADHWMMTVHKPGTIPLNVDPTVYVDAVNAFAQVGDDDSVEEALLAATLQWPQNMLVWMAFGNAYYQQKAYQKAQRAYQQAMTINDQHPAPPHNLAWALIKQDKPEQASAYAQRAVQLSRALPQQSQAQYHSAAEELSKSTVTAERPDAQGSAK